MEPRSAIPGIVALLADLHTSALAADTSEIWPADSIKRLNSAKVLAWSIPASHGGEGLAGGELLDGYEALAGACLTTAFILSQREAAVRRLLAGENAELAKTWLPRLASGDAWATVGLSQLTTSRQHQSPALRAVREAEGGGFVLDGVIPWVTAADQADLVIIGAALDDGRQVLLALSRGACGMTIDAPMPLMALAGSRTSQIRLENVRIDGSALVAGPAESIMAGRPGGVGGLETSCLALGHAGAAIEYLQQEALHRAELVPIYERFHATRTALRRQMHVLAAGSPSPQEMAALRVDCTELALQAAQVALTAAKGAGFLRSHLAQMWCRQALFFLVWSCPRPAAEGIIGRMLPLA
jgi:butyryl-CoA dehydrogenase